MGTVTVIYTAPYNLQPVPEVGKEYHIFDDGKIRPSRHSIAKVLEVIPFKEADEDVLREWCSDVAECYWLYASETDYFVRAKWGQDTDYLYFVRTQDGGWFSLGWFGARLDIDGELYKSMNEFGRYLRDE